MDVTSIVKGIQDGEYEDVEVLTKIVGEMIDNGGFTCGDIGKILDAALDECMELDTGELLKKVRDYEMFKTVMEYNDGNATGYYIWCNKTLVEYFIKLGDTPEELLVSLVNNISIEEVRGNEEDCDKRDHVQDEYGGCLTCFKHSEGYKLISSVICKYRIDTDPLEEKVDIGIRRDYFIWVIEVMNKRDY